MTSHWSKVFLHIPAAAAAKSLQLCPTLCDPIDGLLPGSPVPGILQARTLEWVAISFYTFLFTIKKKSIPTSNPQTCKGLSDNLHLFTF